MEAEEREKLAERSNLLRIELKVWEKDFATSNNGQKASRDDIKKHPEIGQYTPYINSWRYILMQHLASKYKEYNKARDILSGKITQAPPAMHRQTPRKRKHEDGPKGGNSKRLQIDKTPSKGSMRPWEVDPYESPSVIRDLFTPSKKTAIGPTPQKDGQVLGLFDLLQDDGVVASPSKLENGKDKDIQISIQATPRKPRNALEDNVTLKYSRTPASSRKRYTLDAFATPLKSRSINGLGGKTPSSVSKLHFPTPSFLRRDSHRTQMPVVNEDESVTLSPEMVRVPRKPLVRGLSSILAGLRRMEEEAADEDLEALHEMEIEMAGEGKPASKPTAAKEGVLVEDCQPRLPLGGFDDEAMYDSEPEELKNPTLGRDGQPLKVYKKKGQKRTTRRVNMKPTRSKPQPQPEAQPQEDSDDELAAPEETVPETQVDDMAGFGEGRNFDSDESQSEYTASEGGTRYRRPNQTKKNKKANKDGKIKTAARKVGTLAHQNFKRLKLRNSGAKGGAAHNSRFRRKK
jgi:DNA replication regulator SLD2